MSTQTILLIIVSILIGLAGIWIIVLNWCIVVSWLTHKKSSSLNPPLGAVLLCIAIAVLPINPYRWLCISAFIMDIGGLIWMTEFISFFVRTLNPSYQDKILRKRLIMEKETVQNDGLRKKLGIDISNGCSFRSKHLSWDEFQAEFFSMERCYAFLYNHLLIMISTDNGIGYRYVIEDSQSNLIERNVYLTRQELFDNLIVNEKPLHDIWNELS